MNDKKSDKKWRGKMFVPLWPDIMLAEQVAIEYRALAHLLTST
jgi:hypothetical protein